MKFFLPNFPKTVEVDQAKQILKLRTDPLDDLRVYADRLLPGGLQKFPDFCRNARGDGKPLEAIEAGL